MDDDPNDLRPRSIPDGAPGGAAGQPSPRPPAFRDGADRFGDDAFRDDRFDDDGQRAVYASESLADVLADDDRPLANPWTRLGAQFLDGLVYGAVAVPVVVAAIATGAFEADGTGAMEDFPLGIIALAIVLMLAVVGYQMWLLSTTGQTLGKRFLKLRVVDEADGSNPGFVRAVLLRVFAPAVIGQIPLVGVLFALADALFVFRDDRKCIHDHFAKTVVVTEAGGSF